VVLWLLHVFRSFFLKAKVNVPWSPNAGYDDYDPLWWNAKNNIKTRSAKQLLDVGQGLAFVSTVFFPLTSSLGYFLMMFFPALKEANTFFFVLLFIYPIVISFMAMHLLSSYVVWRFYAARFMRS
jgi:hypothetical protein